MAQKDASVQKADDQSPGQYARDAHAQKLCPNGVGQLWPFLGSPAFSCTNRDNVFNPHPLGAH